MFIGTRLSSPRVHSACLGSFGRTLNFVVFIEARYGCRLFHSGMLGSLGRAVRVIGFILVLWGHSGASWRSLCLFRFALRKVGFILVCWVHLAEDWRWSVSLWFIEYVRVLGVFGFIWAFARGIRAHPGVHSGVLWGSSVSFWFIPARSWHCRIYFGSLGSFGRALKVLVYSPAYAKTIVQCSFERVVSFIRVCWVYSGTP